MTVSGNATLSGNILGDRIQNGTTSLDIQSAGGNANITIGGTSNVAVFSTALVTLAANLVPSANITYDLGTSTQRWKDLWLSGNTINLGAATISANATAITMTNPAGGVTVLAGGSGASSITGATVSVTGNITGSYIFGNGSQLTGIDATSIQNGTSSLTVIASGGNIRGNIAGATVTTTHAGGLNVTGLISATGTVTGTSFVGIATSAQYADLAEKYTADAEYAPGTVVSFGGDAEVTASTDADTRVAGVVSTNPAFTMNNELVADHVVTVAFTGRVPCRVTGTVRKGDLMVSAGDGTARAVTIASPKVGTIIGKSLEDFSGDKGTIEIVIGKH